MATSSAIGRRRKTTRKRSSVRGTAAKVGAAKKTTKVGAARKSPAKKVSGAKAPAAVGSMTFSGKRYTKVGCHTTKKAAQDTAKKLRSQGKYARVVERCVFARSK